MTLWRYTTIFGALGMGLLVTSCEAPQAEVGENQERIEIWQGFNTEETEVFREIMAEFEAEWEETHGKDLVIDIQYVAFNDMFTKLRTAALAKITPDIAFVDSIKATDLALGQALVPFSSIDAFTDKYGDLETARKEFVTAAFNAGVVNRLGEEDIYGFPVQTTTVALFWNREMFREKAQELRAAGLDASRAPQTWDELIEYGKVLTDEEQRIYGYGMYGSLWFNFPFFNMYNVDFIEYDENGVASPELNTPYGNAALARIQMLADSGIEGGAWKRSALGPDAGFINRKYAMAITGPWNVENFSNAGLDFDIALIPAPSQEEIDTLGLEPADPELVEELGPLAYTSSNIGGQSGVIMRTCEDRDLAFQILDYFTSEKVQRRWASQLGQIPVRRAAWENLDTSKYPFMPKFMLQLRTARRIPQIPLYGVLESDIFNPQMDLLLQKRQTPEDMTEKMEAAMEEKILKKVNAANPNRKSAAAPAGENTQWISLGISAPLPAGDETEKN